MIGVTRAQATSIADTVAHALCDSVDSALRMEIQRLRIELAQEKVVRAEGDRMAQQRMDELLDRLRDLEVEVRGR